MKIKYFLMAAVVALMTACGTASKVPLTGRTHRISISDAQLLSLSNQEYTKFMASEKRSTDAKNTAMVQRVGRNLANAVETSYVIMVMLMRLITSSGSLILFKTSRLTLFVCLEVRLLFTKDYCLTHRMRQVWQSF